MSDRQIAVVTLALAAFGVVLAGVAAWAAWFPYWWNHRDRRRRAATERRLEEILNHLRGKPTWYTEASQPADEDAIRLGVELQLLKRAQNLSDGRVLYRLRSPGDG